MNDPFDLTLVRDYVNAIPWDGVPLLEAIESCINYPAELPLFVLVQLPYGAYLRPDTPTHITNAQPQEGWNHLCHASQLENWAVEKEHAPGWRDAVFSEVSVYWIEKCEFLLTTAH